MKYSTGFEFHDEYNNRYKILEIGLDYYKCEYRIGEGCKTLIVTKYLSEKFIDNYVNAD